jgi:hypothetical protein
MRHLSGSRKTEMRLQDGEHGYPRLISGQMAFLVGAEREKHPS